METQVKLDELTAEQRSALMAELKAKEADEKNRILAEKKAYTSLIDDAIDELIPKLIDVSTLLCDAKRRVVEGFASATEIKGGLFKVKSNQRSNTFMNSAGDKRIEVGYRIKVSYRDTVNEGVAIVKECVSDLGTDSRSKNLVNIVMQLLSEDKDGNLNPKKVLELRN